MNSKLSKNTIHRLLSDIKQIINTPLCDQGIYYRHDEADILKGRALIIGPENTPYEFGYFIFDFVFPTDYPYKPPKVTFVTSDGYTRFNPNLYVNGKVCLSILNTWRGEQWSGCQTITSVLLSIISIFNEKPLLNEPGVSDTHIDFSKYNKIIKYKTLEIAIYKFLQNNHDDIFFEEAIKHFIKNYLLIRGKVSDLLKNTSSTCIITTSIYNMTVKIDYKTLLENIELLYANILMKKIELNKLNI